jgi:pantoate--beta-alanine ligase
MEGKFRKGHFNGVATIVKHLFEIVTPTNAYFGEKDFQQLQIIKKLVVKQNLNINIIGCEIFRESDGLAMSSRNVRLSKTQRLAAPFIYKTLLSAKELFGTKNANKVVSWVENEFKNHPFLKLEYFEIADEKTLKPIEEVIPSKKYRAFIAVFAGEIRLIDNIRL